MSPDEFRLLTNFLNQLGQVGGVTKDAQAAGLIAEAVARQPDAAYLLVQRALLQDQALNTARERIAALEAQQRTAAAVPSSGFLESGGNAWGRSAGNTPTQPLQPVAVMPSQYTSAPMAAPGSNSGFFGGGGGSFLTSMAATAAGVAGGAFLFQGIESMMHHGDGPHHLLDQQPNAFGGMADSVDNVNTAPSVAADSLPSSDDNGVVDDVASDDGGASSDDSNA